MDWSAAKGRWPHAEQSRFVSTRAHNWHVQQAGSGPSILLLHGAGGASHSWRGIFGPLSERAQVLNLDLPGHGFTRRKANSRTRLTDMAEDVQALLDTLSFEPQIIVGHSAGAAIAMQMALNGSSAKTILALNPALMPFRGLAGLLFPPLAKLLALNPFAAPFFARTAANGKAVRNLIDSTGSTLDAEGLALYRMLIGDAAHVDGALRMMARWNLEPLLEALPLIDLPVTIAVGHNDKTVPPETTRTQVPRLANATLIEVPDLGHLMHEEAPERFVDMVFDTLKT